MTLDDFCAQNDICLVYRPMSTKVRGFCYKIDDIYVVILNPRHSNLKKTLLHEIIHIMQDHFCCCTNAEECEEEVHQLIGSMMQQVDSTGEIFF